MSPNLMPDRAPRVPGAFDLQTIHRGALMSLVTLSLASTLIASPEVTPEQFLAQAKENLCGSFLRFPRVDALQKHTWRCEVVTSTLDSKGKPLKTGLYRLYEKFRGPQGIKTY